MKAIIQSHSLHYYPEQRSKVIPEILIFAQLVKEIRTFYENPKCYYLDFKFSPCSECRV
jgi:hypothetical protein